MRLTYEIVKLNNFCSCQADFDHDSMFVLNENNNFLMNLFGIPMCFYFPDLVEKLCDRPIFLSEFRVETIHNIKWG